MTIINDNEVARAAELKAKLEMVRTENKPRYGRPPKKVGMLTCKTGVKVGWRESTVKFVLRLDDKGRFIAEHGDLWYCSPSKEALQAKMDEVAKVMIDITWSRYIHVMYKATVPPKSPWREDALLDLDDDRADQEVIGVDLSWEVVEYSNRLDLLGVDAHYMKRDVGDDGEPETSQESVRELPVSLIPYTEARLETLRRIRAVLTELDVVMVRLFSGDPDAVGNRIDDLNVAAPKIEFGGKTIAPPPKTKTKKR